VRVALFCHSLLSDWNHGNAHFLRGICMELARRGHEVRAFEPANAWSVENLLREEGPAALAGFYRAYPGLVPTRYELASFDLEAALEGVDLVLVHEWNEPSLVSWIGQVGRRAPGIRILFHDTHHRAVTQPHGLARVDLSGFDGVLAYGAALQEVYLARGWASRVWVWHEAADTRVFRPLPGTPAEGDLVWVGNWGDEERTAELEELLLAPARALGLCARAYGVRYPPQARAALREAGIDYAGWVPNYAVPRIFAAYRVTVHIPRRPYVLRLRGIPTIRPFEALSCGIPLVCAPWEDEEGLFRTGRDYLVARDGEEMQRCLRDILSDPALAASLAQSGLETVRKRHTCAHRVDELLEIARGLGVRNLRPAAGAR
jgi:spore maturation protein CgeB